jgi:uncharacterized repeat protein (TIGR01451 family)
VNVGPDSRSTASTVTKETNTVTSRRRLSEFFSPTSGLLCALGVMVGLLVVVGSVLPIESAQAASPELTLQITPEPGSFHRGESSSTDIGGDFYNVTATNTGDAPTSGPYTVTDTLPASLNLGEGALVLGDAACTGEFGSPTPIICTRSTPLAPGETVSLRIPVDVGKDAPDTVTTAATISGGGAPDASASDLTPVVDPPPFTVKSFTATTTDEAEANYTLAGGHPFQNRVRFDVPLNDKGWAVEFLKDADVDLPTGFLGNPAAEPRCPIGNIEKPEFFPG